MDQTVNECKLILFFSINFILNCKHFSKFLDCPSKECFRKVANFERFLRLYAQKNQQLTQFECVLRDVSIFFNCIKASAGKQPKKMCKKKRYAKIKKRIAKLLSETRLCIGG
ncbi:hypothetical protein BLA29_011061 [Euroglyphus maynei]|uniref:Uncharacterized protein n=1 Tax=Euroglyphus maynei TaxID=6958 RepID=A0A1Y3AUG9_EURMA|nr:hypothetical protein BLA29_011061 [Euroglyphus maynei]